jgi:hypothetical protein
MILSLFHNLVEAVLNGREHVMKLDSGPYAEYAALTELVWPDGLRATTMPPLNRAMAGVRITYC